METLGAEAGAKIDHVIVASVSRQVAFVHDTRLIGERRAALREALLEVLIERLLHRTWIGRLRDDELRCGSQPAGLALGRVGVGRRGLGRGRVSRCAQLGRISVVARAPPLNKTARERSCPPTWQR